MFDGVGSDPMQRPTSVDTEHVSDDRMPEDITKSAPALSVLHTATRFPPTVGANPVIPVDTIWFPTMLRYDRVADIEIISFPLRMVFPHSSTYWSELMALSNIIASPLADDSRLPSNVMPAPSIAAVTKWMQLPLSSARKSPSLIRSDAVDPPLTKLVEIVRRSPLVWRNWQPLNSATPPDQMVPLRVTPFWNVLPVASIDAFAASVMLRDVVDDVTVLRISTLLFPPSNTSIVRDVTDDPSMEYAPFVRLPPRIVTVPVVHDTTDTVDPDTAHSVLDKKYSTTFTVDWFSTNRLLEDGALKKIEMLPLTCRLLPSWSIRPPLPCTYRVLCPGPAALSVVLRMYISPPLFSWYVLMNRQLRPLSDESSNTSRDPSVMGLDRRNTA